LKIRGRNVLGFCRQLIRGFGIGPRKQVFKKPSDIKYAVFGKRLKAAEMFLKLFPKAQLGMLLPDHCPDVIGTVFAFKKRAGQKGVFFIELKEDEVFAVFIAEILRGHELVLAGVQVFHHIALKQYIHYAILIRRPPVKYASVRIKRHRKPCRIMENARLPHKMLSHRIITPII
jgi:hypothetical protein